MTETVDPDLVVLPALLRAARGAYTHNVRARLEAAGFDDLPRNGSYVLGGMVNHDGSAGNLVRQLGVSKQAASQLIDTMVVRGYLTREGDPADRRRVSVEATDRGRAAAAVIRAGVVATDTELAGMITPAELAGLRAGLVALCDIRERVEDEARAIAAAGAAD